VPAHALAVGEQALERRAPRAQEGDVAGVEVLDGAVAGVGARRADRWQLAALAGDLVAAVSSFSLASRASRARWCSSRVPTL
jgi:hypothetical protein